MNIESFDTAPLQRVIPSYLYSHFSDDDDLQAFVAAQNALAQGYLDWFNNTPLGLYTSPNIKGCLLDWVAQGVYGISRPVLSMGKTYFVAGYNSSAYNAAPYDGAGLVRVGASSAANDDIYKRVLTWNLYRGDGQVFTIGWLKNRISRFINGANGSDFPVLEDQPSISVSGGVFTVSRAESAAYDALQLCYAGGALAFPFQYRMQFLTVSFINDGGVLQLTTPYDYPLSPVGLAAGSVWYNGGAVSVVPGITPNPSAPPVYFAGLMPPDLLALGGGNLPLADPVNAGQLWSNGGLISVSP